MLLLSKDPALIDKLIKNISLLFVKNYEIIHGSQNVF